MTTRQWYQTIVKLIIVMVILWGVGEFYWFVQGKKLQEKREQQLLTITTDIRAYCPKKCCCGRWADGKFSSGAKAKGMAIASKFLSRGIKVYVPGYGLTEVKDHGPNLIEVFFEEHEDAVEWGVKRNVRVKVLGK